MNRSTGLVAVLVVLGAAGIFIAHLLQQNFELKVELGSLRSQQAALASAPPPAAASPADTPEPTPNRVVTETARQLMVDALADETGAEKKLWVRVEPRDREASAFVEQISAVFRDSGWEVNVLDTQGLRFKPGLLLLLATDQEQPSYVKAAQKAIAALGEEVTTGSGYLSYYASKKAESAEWRGTEFLPEQTYVLLVGRKG